MENEKVKYLIDMIYDMDIKNKLRLAICISQSKWSDLIYNRKENYEKFDKMLKYLYNWRIARKKSRQCLLFLRFK